MLFYLIRLEPFAGLNRNLQVCCFDICCQNWATGLTAMGQLPQSLSTPMAALLQQLR